MAFEEYHITLRPWVGLGWGDAVRISLWVEGTEQAYLAAEALSAVYLADAVRGGEHECGDDRGCDQDHE